MGLYPPFSEFTLIMISFNIFFRNQNEVEIQQNNTQSCKVYQQQVQQLQIKYQQAVSIGLILAGVVFFMTLLFLCCFGRKSSCGTSCYQKSTSCFRKNQLHPESNSNFGNREEPEGPGQKDKIGKMNEIEKMEKVDEFAVCLTGTPVRNIMNKTRTRQPAGISFV